VERQRARRPPRNSLLFLTPLLEWGEFLYMINPIIQNKLFAYSLKKVSSYSK